MSTHAAAGIVSIAARTFLSTRMVTENRTPAAGDDDLAGVERRVGPHHDRPARRRGPGGQDRLGGGDGVGDQPRRPERRVRGVGSQLGRGDDRGRVRCADRGHQRIELLLLLHANMLI
jgi:hypothetical protein